MSIVTFVSYFQVYYQQKKAIDTVGYATHVTYLQRVQAYSAKFLAS